MNPFHNSSCSGLSLPAVKWCLASPWVLTNRIYRLSTSQCLKSVITPKGPQWWVCVSVWTMQSGRCLVSVCDLGSPYFCWNILLAGLSFGKKVDWDFDHSVIIFSCWSSPRTNSYLFSQLVRTNRFYTFEKVTERHDFSMEENVSTFRYSWYIIYTSPHSRHVEYTVSFVFLKFLPAILFAVLISSQI